MLHISCHGISNEQHTMRANWDEVREEGHFLLFENLYGAGELVSAKQIRLLLNTDRHDIDVIFVAACNSELIGRIFQRCGAKHVVCVKQQRFVLDEAAIQFTRTFYQHLFKGTPICIAFKAAKNAVAGHIRDAEANLFLMLLPEDFENQQDSVFGTKQGFHEECESLPEI